MSISRTTIAFICQPGELEIKSLLLAFTLTRKWEERFNYVVLVPQHISQEISGSVFQLFRKLGIGIKIFRNVYMETMVKPKHGDWMSNKFCGLASLETKDDVIFLDSDMMCFGMPDIDLFSGTDLAAKPADFFLEMDWERLFQKAKIPFPQARVICTFDNKPSVPYYNTGFIYFRANMVKSFCVLWEKHFRWLSSPEINRQIAFDPFHRDQIAFALALRESGYEIQDLNESFNFPARKRNNLISDIKFVHYHDVYTVARFNVLKMNMQTFANAYSGFSELLLTDKRWGALCTNRFIALKAQRVKEQFRKTWQRNLKKLKAILHIP